MQIRWLLASAALVACGVAGGAPPTAPSPAPTRLLASDLTDDAITDIDLSARRSAVVVAYDRRTLRVLVGCRADAAYLTRGLELRETTTKPSPDRTLVVRVVGEKTASIVKLGRAELHESTAGACAGATHFVSRIMVGAFVERGESAGRSSLRHDGKLEACRASDSNADAPPMDCRGAVAFELTPISET